MRQSRNITIQLKVLYVLFKFCGFFKLKYNQKRNRFEYHLFPSIIQDLQKLVTLVIFLTDYIRIYLLLLLVRNTLRALSGSYGQMVIIALLVFLSHQYTICKVLLFVRKDGNNIAVKHLLNELLGIAAEVQKLTGSAVQSQRLFINMDIFKILMLTMHIGCIIYSSNLICTVLLYNFLLELVFYSYYLCQRVILGLLLNINRYLKETALTEGQQRQHANVDIDVVFGLINSVYNFNLKFVRNFNWIMRLVLLTVFSCIYNHFMFLHCALYVNLPVTEIFVTTITNFLTFFALPWLNMYMIGVVNDSLMTAQNYLNIQLTLVSLQHERGKLKLLHDHYFSNQLNALTHLFTMSPMTLNLCSGVVIDRSFVDFFILLVILNAISCVQYHMSLANDNISCYTSLRSCIIGPELSVKVCSIGTVINRTAYATDYCKLEGVSGRQTQPMPIRWMAWESVLLGKFTSKSDVWSFAVTLWEILTFAREQPYEHLSDENVIENIGHVYQDDKRHVLLTMPQNCPREIYDLMCECWQRSESSRPNFREIHLFLQRKNLGFKPPIAQNY